jgi:hypothetical protein
MSEQTLAIVKWIKGTPELHQQDIVFFISFIGRNWLTSNIPTDPMDSPQEFITWIESHTGNAHQNIGFVLALRALIDFFIIRSRGTTEAWAEARRRIEGMRTLAENKKENERMISEFERMLNDLPQREKDWLEICGRWNTLRAKELSDDAIDKWERDIASTPQSSLPKI